MMLNKIRFPKSSEKIATKYIPQYVCFDIAFPLLSAGFP